MAYKYFQYRLYVNANQARELAVMLETHRRLYNACLHQKKSAYEESKKVINYCSQSSWFKTERKINPFFARLNFSSAQATMRRLDNAYQRFFNRVKLGQTPGYPKFKAANQFNAFVFAKNGDGATFRGDTVRIQHVGIVKVKNHRPHEGTIKTITISKKLDKWYITLSCELPDHIQFSNGLPSVGLDVGLENFATASDGEIIENPRFHKKELKNLKRLSSSLSRKVKGGRNRSKTRYRYAREHQKIARRRRDHHHKQAIKLVRRYGSIAVESLNINSMMRNHRLARSIADAGWYSFLRILHSTSKRYGCEIIEVNSSGTSQECSRCGSEVRKSLAVRTHDCSNCGLSVHRDMNAALNILARARTARAEPVGVNFACEVSQEAEQFIAV